MKYVVLVSHGEFAPGLHKAVNMLAGEEREDVLSTSLVNGMGADEFAENVKQVLSVVGEDDEIILFADIVGGSPLATTANVLLETGLLAKTRMIGGMNLPLVLTCVLSKDDCLNYINLHFQSPLSYEISENIIIFFPISL